MSDAITYLQAFAPERVDTANHVIRGVKIISMGEMKGHGFHADRLTLEQTKKLIPSVGLKAKVNHRGVDGVLTLNGRVKEPYIEGGSLKGNWYLNPGMPTTPSIEAIALHQPGDAGFSLTCHKTLQRINGKDYMRMTALKSCDLVDDPAGNESLLSVDTAKKGTMELSELQAAHEKLQKEHEALKGQFTELSATCAKHQDFLENHLPTILEEMAGDDEGGDEAELSARYGRRGSRKPTELSADTLKKAVADATKPILTELATVKTKLEATETTLAAIKQVPAKPNEPGATSGNPDPSNTELQGKLLNAATELERAEGSDRAALAARFAREFGADWKSKLTAESKAKVTELTAKK